MASTQPDAAKRRRVEAEPVMPAPDMMMGMSRSMATWLVFFDKLYQVNKVISYTHTSMPAFFVK